MNGDATLLIIFAMLVFIPICMLTYRCIHWCVWGSLEQNLICDL
uniref:Uncharacterized protein n=1 Tax=Megaviridae environmental sample TaxID=1737588 RepID=A0A5J6VIH4_9VIRU|nr:MAG: hypothetical protein [Megaviridae environmental sample]